MRETPIPAGSDLHQFLLFLGEQLVDLRDVAVGELLHLVLRLALGILGELLVLEQGLDLGVGVAADIADRDPCALAFVADDLDHIAAALFSQRRQGHPDRCTR